MKVVVVALGKIGLPLAAFAAMRGHQVVGCDISQQVVDQVNSGVEPFPGETGLQEAIKQTIESGNLLATTDTVAAVAAGADLILIVPPLIVDERAKPDWRAIDAAVTDVAKGLAQAADRNGSANGPDGRPPSVVVETTLPVGSTRSRVAPLVERVSGLREGSDFYAVHSPERVFSGRIFEDLVKYPKLVGALSAEGEEATIDRYEQLLGAETVGMDGAEAAELTKLAETTYRDINIGFANELARYSDTIGVDVQKVIAAANSQPYSHIHQPGVAVGGHCIPVYPRFYLEGDPDAQIPQAARQSNEQMPAYAVSVLGKLLEQQAQGSLVGKRILILGAAYRGGVKETAFSGVFPLVAALQVAGATALVSDPLYDELELTQLGLVPWDEQPIDALLVQADHHEYQTATPDDYPGIKVAVDGRGVLPHALWQQAGVPVALLGSGRYYG